MRYQSMSSIINECLENYHDLKKEFHALIEEWETMPQGEIEKVRDEYRS